MTKPRVVSLTVHRNTRERRQRHAVSENLVTFARSMARRKDIEGFAIVTWEDGGQVADAAWMATPGSPILSSVMPEFVKETIARKRDMQTAMDHIYGVPPEDEGA